jgi:hypothetical protein
MQYIYDSDTYKVARISGPTHNLLGLAFGDCENCPLEVVPLKKKDDDDGIDADDVREQVLSGIQEINEELGVNYKVRKIQFVPSDTSSRTVYKELTKEIVRKIEEGDGGFLRG